MDLNTISLLVSIVGIFVSVGLFFLSTIQIQNSVRTAFDIDVRKTINRIERNKERFKKSNPEAYKELFDIQEELEAMSKKFLAMFRIKK